MKLENATCRSVSFPTLQIPMPRRDDILSILVAGACLGLLSACAIKPRLYSAGELASVADQCGVADSELAQIGADVALLYLLTPEPSDEQFVCVARWAKRSNLRLVYVEEIVVEPEPAPEPTEP